MRILFLSTIFPRPYAPVRGIYCQHICRTLAEEDEVAVISPRSWVEALKHPTILAPRDDTLLTGGIPTRYPTYFYPPKVMRTQYGRFMWASVRGCVKDFVKRFSPDCVLSYWAHPDGETAARAAAAAGVPSAIIVGGSDVLMLTRDRKRRRCVVSALQRADAVVAVSQDLRRKLLELGIESSKIHVIHTGVDDRLFHPGSRADARQRLNINLGERVILYVGNLVHGKGLDVLLNAMSMLSAESSKPHLYIVGAGPELGPLRLQAQTNRLSDRIHFIGALRQEQLPDWFRAADVTVLPSRSEGIPNVLRESLACGTPFVATRVGGIPEISCSPANRLVAVDNANGLANALRLTLSESSSERCVFEPSRTWHDTADDFRQLFKSLISSRDVHTRAWLCIA